MLELPLEEVQRVVEKRHPIAAKGESLFRPDGSNAFHERNRQVGERIRLEGVDLHLESGMEAGDRRLDESVEIAPATEPWEPPKDEDDDDRNERQEGQKEK